MLGPQGPSKIILPAFLSSCMHLLALLRALACAVGVAAPDPRTTPSVRTQTRSGGAIQVTSVNLLSVKGGVLVSGRVEPAFGYYYPFVGGNSHLDVDVLDPQDRLVRRVTTTYSPWPIPITHHSVPGRATYAVRVPVVLAAGDTVRVSHCHARMEDCPTGQRAVPPSGKS